MRIGEQQAGGFGYHLPDALGSVRQLTNANANVTLAQSYESFGSVMTATGNGSSSFGWAGEARDASGLVFLRARYYSVTTGRFFVRDSWPGNIQMPGTLHPYLCSYNSPLNYTDPSGHCGTVFDFLLGLVGVSSCPSPIENGLEVVDPAPNLEWTEGVDLAPRLDWVEGVSPAPQFDWVERIDLAPCLDWVERVDPAPRGAQLYASKSGDDDDDDFGSTLRLGPHAGESIPARGPERDWKPGEIEAIDRIGRTTGCHTCGSKDPGTTSGHFIPDHQPSSQINFDNKSQRLYPHCIHCSRKQGGEVTEYLRRRRLKEDGG